MAGSRPAFSRRRAGREAEDARILALLQGMEEVDLDRICRFTLLSQPGERSMPRHLMLATVFNHQTHHRAQVHAMLSEAGVAPPGLDIVLYPEALG